MRKGYEALAWRIVHEQQTPQQSIVTRVVRLPCLKMCLCSLDSSQSLPPSLINHIVAPAASTLIPILKRSRTPWDEAALLINKPIKCAATVRPCHIETTSYLTHKRASPKSRPGVSRTPDQSFEGIGSDRPTVPRVTRVSNLNGVLLTKQTSFPSCQSGQAEKYSFFYLSHITRCTFEPGLSPG